MILNEWEAIEWDGPLAESERDSFINYLAQVWEARPRLPYNDEEDETEEELTVKQTKQGFFSFGYDKKFAARNYVGVVQHKGRRIHVVPKIFEGDTKTDLAHCNLNLINWLSYCRKFRFPFNTANLSTCPFDDLLETLIWLFARHTEEVTSTQPYQAYELVQEETDYLRGQLVFDEYIRSNLSTGRWQHFHCAYQPFVYDNLFNRIVKCVARRLRLATRHDVNRQSLDNILFLLDDVSDIACRASDCDRVRLNPLYEELSQVLEGCRMFLDEHATDSSTELSQSFCFLVPMEYVFEDFVFGFLYREFRHLNPRSQSESMLAYNEGKPVFKMKHDIIFQKKLIVDTKYKLRNADGRGKAGVVQGDMYQMLAYAMRRNVHQVLLLYPQPSKSAPLEETKFIIPHEESNPAKETIVSVDNLRIDVSSDGDFLVEMKGRFTDLMARLEDSSGNRILL